MIKRTEVRIFVETAVCDDCDVEMISDGSYLASNPPQYDNVCPDCGNTIRTRGFRYPRNVYEPV